MDNNNIEKDTNKITDSEIQEASKNEDVVKEESTVTEEIKSEEAPLETKEEPKTELDEAGEEFTPLTKNDLIAPNDLQVIDNLDERLLSYSKGVDDFNVIYKKSKRINIILLIAVAIIFVLAVVLSSYIGNWYILILAIGLIGYFVASSLFSRSSEKKLTEIGTNSLKEYFTIADSYYYQNPAFKDVAFDYNSKLNASYFTSLNLFKNVSTVAGRDLIVGTLDDINFVSGDGSIKTLETNEKGKKLSCIVFYGKASFINKTYVDEGRLIVYLKGKGNDAPTKVDDLEVKDNILSDRFIVYTSNGNEKILSKEVVSALERYEISDNLLDLFITFDTRHTSFLFSYRDEIMNISVDQPINKDYLDQHRNDIEKMVEVVRALERK